MRNYHDNRTGFARRQREDDEYVNGPDKMTHKTQFTVTHPDHNDGKPHRREVTLTNTTKSKQEATAAARQHLEAKGFKIQEAKEKQEYDYEGDMARGQLRSIIANAQQVHDMLKPDTNIAEWVQSKITLSADYISTVADYMQSEVNETTHRIGLTVTDPNHPMVSKRKETIQKTVRVTSDSKDKAIDSAIAHHKRKGYKVHDHHYIGTVNEAMDKEHPIAKEYQAMKQHDIKTLRNMIKGQHKIIDTSEYRTKDHAISAYLRHKHGDKRVAAAMGLKEENMETRIWEAWGMGKRDPQKSIKVGHQVRSYDFPGMHDDHYIEGHVVGETPHTYHIRTNKVVRAGKEVPIPAHMTHIEAPKGKGMFSDAYAVHKIVAKQDAVAAKAPPAQGAAKTFAQMRKK